MPQTIVWRPGSSNSQGFSIVVLTKEDGLMAVISSPLDLSTPESDPNLSHTRCELTILVTNLHPFHLASLNMHNEHFETRISAVFFIDKGFEMVLQGSSPQLAMGKVNRPKLGSDALSIDSFQSRNPT